MARVVVVGGGFGGLAAALRLAKLGHEVTLVERSAALGGALSEVRVGDFAWDAGPSYTLLPAVVRDLFRKSGRPIERELDLVPQEVVREHRFADGSSVQVPHGRAAQLAAFEELGTGLGRRWVDHVASYADDWDVLRRGYLENPWQPDDLPRDLASRLDSRETLFKRLKKTFKDERLRLVAGHPAVAEGHDLRNVPAWAGSTAYVEQRFGVWTVEGGMARLGAALVDRLATRKVTALTGTEATDLVVREGRVVAVETTAGLLDADVVVCAIDPRRLPALASYVVRTMPAIPPVVAYLGLEGDAPVLSHEVVLHGDPTLVVRTGWPLAGRRLDADRPRARPTLRGPPAGAGAAPDRRAAPGGRAGRPQPARAGRALGRLTPGRALAGPRDGATAARAAHAGRRGVRRRGACHAGRRAALRRALGGVGGC